MSIAAGWYPDPLAADALRWWNGDGWTEFVQRMPPQPVEPAWASPTPIPPAPIQPTPIQPTPAGAAFSSTPVVQPYAAPAWAAGAAAGPYGYPAPPRRRPPWLIGTAVAVVVVALVAACVQMSVARGSAAKVAATQYFRALERGDTGAAYQGWCAADRAVYPEALFRAQHEWRAGHAVTVLTSFAGVGKQVSVGYRDDKGQWKDLPMEKTAGRWAVCPHGERLDDDMANCGCMTPTQRLQAHVAWVTRSDPEHPFVEVTCPTIPALVDGRPIRCSAEAADGRTWTVVATESANATRTAVDISPSGTVS